MDASANIVPVQDSLTIKTAVPAAVRASQNITKRALITFRWLFAAEAASAKRRARALQKPAQIASHWLLRLMALTLLFALLSYMGSALYHRAGGLTTVKPFGGIALALLLIYGRG